MKLAVCTVSPPNYLHSAAFSEVAETLVWAAESLGHDVVSTTETDLPGRRTIVLGANLLRSFPKPVGPDTILYNLEQVQPGPWFDSGVIDLFRRCTVWDYSTRNAAELERLGIQRPRVVPIGWAPILNRIEETAEDIDVLFYGCVNDRRRVLLDELRRAGVRVQTLFGVYGGARDRFIARSRIVLNMHFYEARVFEIVRASYLLANGRAVVSERGASAEEEAPFESGIAFADYRDVTRTCLELLQDPARRAELGRQGKRLMEGRPATEFLREALGEDTARSGAGTPEVRSDETAAKGKPAPNIAISRLFSAATAGPTPAYYSYDRPEVVSRIDTRGKAVLEVGSAAGAMGRKMLENGAREVVGIDIVPDAVRVARTRLTSAYRLDLNQLPELPYPDHYFDVFTFADVLEHLIEPDAVLRHLRRWLAPDGEIVVSIPNVRHESVLLPLLVNGTWDYADAGILDRTHLRFYTLEGARQLMAGGGFRLHGEIQAVTSKPSQYLEKVGALVAALGGNAARFRQEALAIQYVFTAKPEHAEPASVAEPLLDPWRGSRPTRLLLAPNLSDAADRWQELLLTLADSSAVPDDVTVGVALPLAQMQAPPDAAHLAASRGTLDLLLIEAPADTNGWTRLLAGAGSVLATSASPELRAVAERIGVPVVDAASFLQASAA